MKRLRHSTRAALPPRPRRLADVALAVALVATSLTAGGCFQQTFQRGYLVPEGALEQIPLGSTQEQVLVVLGTPSTVATVSGEAFYYISQRAVKEAAFLPQKVVDQRVIAVYFDRDRRVERLANYGLKDGKVFDFVTRTTPSGGQELSYLTYLLKIIGKD
ncbi:MAG: outer membrane protein assembly factor BamE [Rhizobiales bacterium]|nr:outer membrane protein assembly factor BamE [Hyphomicrobiales bacterium]